MSYTLNKIIQGIINLYGKRLFRIKNDKVIDRIENNTYIFCQLDLQPLKQNISDTCITLHSGLITGLVIKDLSHVTIDHIELEMDTSKANCIVHSILDVSFLNETNNDLMSAFEDIKQCLSKYIQWVTLDIELITIKLSDVTITIHNVNATVEQTNVRLIESPFANMQGLSYSDTLTIDKVELLDLTMIPYIWLDDSESNLYTIINTVAMNDTVIEHIRVSSTVNIKSISHPSVMLSDIVLGKSLKAEIKDLASCYKWLNEASDWLSTIFDRIIIPSKTKIDCLSLELTGQINGSANIDSYCEGMLTGLSIQTTDWSLRCEELSMINQTVNHIHIVNPEKLKKTVDLLLIETDSDSHWIIKDCVVSGSINGVTYQCILDFTSKLTDISCICYLNDVKVIEVKASSLTEIDSVYVTLDPKAYDLVYRLLGAWNTKETQNEDVNPLMMPVLTESMLIESYIACNLEEETEKVSYHLLATIIEDYTNKPSVISCISISSIIIDLYTTYTQQPFARISLADTHIKQTQDLEKTMTANPVIVTHLTTKLSITDLLVDNEWKVFADVPCIQLSYSVYDNDYDISVYCKSITSHIREQCLVKLIAFISPRQCLTGKSRSGIEKLSINEIPVNVSFLPIITSGIPMLSMSNHKIRLCPIYLQYCSVDLAVSTIKTKWLDSLSLLHIITDIKAIQPYASPIYRICTICTNYISRPSNTQFLRTFTQSDFVSYVKNVGIEIFKLIS